jgi:hypothetical protein
MAKGETEESVIEYLLSICDKNAHDGSEEYKLLETCPKTKLGCSYINDSKTCETPGAIEGKICKWTSNGCEEGLPTTCEEITTNTMCESEGLIEGKTCKWITNKCVPKMCNDRTPNGNSINPCGSDCVLKETDNKC